MGISKMPDVNKALDSVQEDFKVLGHMNFTYYSCIKEILINLEPQSLSGYGLIEIIGDCLFPEAFCSYIYFIFTFCLFLPLLFVLSLTCFAPTGWKYIHI